MAGAGVEPVGVEAKVEDAGKFLSDLVKMERAYDNFVAVSAKAVKFNQAAGRYQDTASGKFVKFADVLSLAGKSAGEAANGVDQAQQAISGVAAVAAPATAGLSLLAVTVGNILADAFQAVTGFIKEATSALLDFGSQSLMIAGRVDELNRSAIQLGLMAGYSQSEMEGFIGGLIDTGIRADVAATLIAQLTRFEADLTKATELATVAQNSAVIAGIDSSDALEKLTHAAATSSPIVARHAGLTVNFTKAQEDLADELGTSREALTESQKVQANFNAILSEGAKIAGVYKAAMDSPTKALRSLGREVYNLQAQLGAPFLSAFASIVGVMRKFVQYLAEATREGGALYPVLVQLGAVASLIADGIEAGATQVLDTIRRVDDNVIANLGQVVTGALRKGSEMIAAFIRGIWAPIADLWGALLTIARNIFDNFTQVAAGAFRYGAELIVQLAKGIIQAATTILVQAMQYVGSILSFWLSPGSPPRVAPDIDKWGTEAMAEYLRGFTKADFGVLNKLEGVFRQALGEKGLAGVIDELLTAVNIGEVTDELFNAIVAGAGEMGQELALLARLQIGLAEATERAANADKAYLAAQDEVNKQVREYNQMLRQGATAEELAAKKEQIKAAEEAREAAKKENAAAQEGLSTLEERADAQDELVKMLLKLKQLQGAGAGAGGGGGGGGIGGGIGGGMPTPELPGMPGAGDFDFETAIAEAIKQAKQDLLTLFTGENSPFAPLITAWQEEVQPRIDEISGILFGTTDEWGQPVEGLIPKFQNFALEVSTALDTVKTGFGEAQTLISEQITLIGQAWDSFKTTFQTSAGQVSQAVQPIITGFMQFATSTMSVLMPIIQQLSNMFSNILTAALQLVSAYINSYFLPVWQAVFAFVQGTLMPLWRAMAQLMTAIVGKATEVLAGIWQNILLPALVVVEQQLIGPLKSAFNAVAAFIKLTVVPILNKLGDIILPKIKTAFDAIATAVNFVIKKIKDLADKISNIEIPEWLQPGSPPPLYYALMNVGDAMERLGKLGPPAFDSAFGGGAGGGQVGSRTVTNYTTVSPQLNIGPNTFNNGLDLAIIEAVMQRVLADALSGV